MAVAVIQDFPQEETERSTTNYDAIHEKIKEHVTENPGLIIHTAGWTGKGFRIIEVWESKEAYDAFMRDVVMPVVMEETGGAGAPPVESWYELHNVLVA